MSPAKGRSFPGPLFQPTHGDSAPGESGLVVLRRQTAGPRGGVELHGHIHSLLILPIAPGLGKTARRRIPHVDARPGEAKCRTADHQLFGVRPCGDQPLLQFGKQRAAVAAAPYSRINGQDVDVTSQRARRRLPERTECEADHVAVQFRHDGEVRRVLRPEQIDQIRRVRTVEPECGRRDPLERRSVRWNERSHRRGRENSHRATSDLPTYTAVRNRRIH